MSSSSTIVPARTGAVPAPAHYFADMYTFKWSELSLRQPLISACAVALCLAIGIASGHPGGALVAGGGALTIGFGVNQRIGDSRVLPMLFAVVFTSTATLAGTIVGHRGYAIVLASVAAAAIYGVLTVRNSGVSWVGQQASVALFVASAFPSHPRAALTRAGLILAGRLVQMLITSVGLQLLPELRKDVTEAPLWLYHSLRERPGLLYERLLGLSSVLPQPDRRAAVIYSTRLMLTVALATELYRRLGIQSGYWIPMTALLVQKPAFFETLNRGLMRVAGTLAGATLATILVAHVSLSAWALAGLTTIFAFASFATNAVNYGLFAVFLTSYIVFLLSLNQIPGPEIAHRRALCTAAGAGIALLIHLDALRRHRNVSTHG